ncbi:hypothetical protein HAX54_047783 [Datura stramonium]|uniref:Uncharacterized protein n=1 Tax=Datura stramonium TaxID=4076 RepID=A0ABS8WMD5_DATST|nr:hypothetical protein [Datura stramonium]
MRELPHSDIGKQKPGSINVRQEMVWGRRLLAIRRLSPMKCRWNTSAILWWLQATDLIPRYIGDSRIGPVTHRFVAGGWPIAPVNYHLPTGQRRSADPILWLAGAPPVLFASSFLISILI